MSEAPQIRRKRLYMRSIRRGIKEMDLILGGFAETELAGLGAPELDAYERLLEENDHDLYAWVSGQMAPPETYREIVALIVGKQRVNAPGIRPD